MAARRKNAPKSSIDKPARTPDNPELTSADSEDPLEVDVQLPEGSEEIPESGITVDIGEHPLADQPPPGEQEFDGNLAEHVDKQELDALGMELDAAIREDERSRADWMRDYRDSLQYLGIKEEKRSQPWMGACGTVHPMILEAIVRYQSRALVKLFPSDGPVKLTIDPIETNEEMGVVINRAQKKFNNFLRDKMPEFRDEADRLLFSQAQVGFAAKKNYFHSRLKRVTSELVLAENLIIPYGYHNLDMCPRITEIVRKPFAEVEALQRSGFYRNIVLTPSPIEHGTDVEKAKAELVGQRPAYQLDDTIDLHECHIDLFIEADEFVSDDGDLSPYVVTLDKETTKVLSIRRNWREGTSPRLRRRCFIPYPFVPADGSYAYGYIHLIGQIASSVTKITRQLVDAGSLSNLPGLLKTKYARMSSVDPIAPGEARDVDVSAEDLQKSFFPLPYKEPSQTLLVLLQGLVEEGKQFSSTADLDISASSQNAPVGTTLALLERQTEVANAVQSRLHDSFRKDLCLIIDLLAEYQPDDYMEIFGELDQIGAVTAVPAGDPTSATQSQRLIMLQSAMQASVQAPQVYNMSALHRQMLTAMGLDEVETIVPDTTKIEPMDPIQETMAMMTGKPVKAFEYQDHDAHLGCHMAVMQSPYYQQMFQQNPAAMQIMQQGWAHIAEHVAFQLRSQIQQMMGTQLPPLGSLPPQLEVALSNLESQAMQRLLAQQQGQAQQQQAQQQQQDPAFQLEQAKLQLEQQEASQKNQLAQQKLQLEASNAANKQQIERERIASQERIAAAGNDSREASEAQRHLGQRRDSNIKAGSAILQHLAATEKPPPKPTSNE